MRCYECIHYNVCGNAITHTDVDVTKVCKQALPRKEIEDLKKELQKAQKEIKNLKVELEYATDCINEVDDALYRGGKNDWAQQAIYNYQHRHSDSL